MKRFFLLVLLLLNMFLVDQTFSMVDVAREIIFDEAALKDFAETQGYG